MLKWIHSGQLVGWPAISRKTSSNEYFLQYEYQPSEDGEIRT